MGNEVLLRGGGAAGLDRSALYRDLLPYLRAGFLKTSCAPTTCLIESKQPSEGSISYIA